MKPMSGRTKKFLVASIISTAITAMLWLATATSYVVDQLDEAAATDAASVGVLKSGAGGSIIDPDAEKFAGIFTITQSRPCEPGMVDVTDLDQAERTIAEVSGAPVCGDIWSSTQPNAMTHSGAADMLACYFTATSCPAANAQHIELFTAGSLVRTATQAGMTELSSASHATYVRRQISSWTCTGNAGSANNCASGSVSWNNVSTDWPALVGLGVVDSASGAGLLFSYSGFSRDLAQNDSLSASYTFTLQSTAD